VLFIRYFGPRSDGRESIFREKFKVNLNPIARSAMKWPNQSQILRNPAQTNLLPPGLVVHYVKEDFFLSFACLHKVFGCIGA
jgi:hypothetical protein